MFTYCCVWERSARSLVTSAARDIMPSVFHILPVCGICGYVDQTDPVVLRRMTDGLVHRGLNDQGFHEVAGTGLAVRRLSIIEVSSGHHSIPKKAGSIGLPFSGESHNHNQISCVASPTKSTICPTIR